MLSAVGRLVRGARAADVTVLHAVAARRADGKGASRNARLFRAAERLPVRQLLGSSAVEIAEEIGAEPSDLFSTRLHGLSPLAGTDADALLRNLGCRTLLIVGVSANVAIPNAVFNAVNLGYQVVLPRDGIAGVPVRLRRHPHREQPLPPGDDHHDRRDPVLLEAPGPRPRLQAAFTVESR